MMNDNFDYEVTCPYCGSYRVNWITIKKIIPSTLKEYNSEYRYKYYCNNCKNKFKVSIFDNGNETIGRFDIKKKKRKRAKQSLMDVKKNIEKASPDGKVFAITFDK